MAHRFASIRRAKRIIVLEQGRKVQEGSPNELEQQELYRFSPKAGNIARQRIIIATIVYAKHPVACRDDERRLVIRPLPIGNRTTKRPAQGLAVLVATNLWLGRDGAHRARPVGCDRWPDGQAPQVGRTNRQA